MSLNPARVTVRIVGTGGIYASAVLLLFVGEMLFARNTTASEFGQYSLARQAIPLLAALALFGYDQALTREVAASGQDMPQLDRRQYQLVLRGFFLGGVVGYYLWSRLEISPLVASVLPVACAGVAASSLASGLLRATRRTLSAAFAQQGYRLVTGLVLSLSATSASATSASWILAVGAGAIGLTSLSAIHRGAEPRFVVGADSHRLMRRIGVGYSLSMISLAAGDWIDQILVGELGGDTDDIGRYAITKLITIYPLLSIGSVLGFVALPAIAARRRSLTQALGDRWLGAGALGTVLLTALAVPCAAWVLDTVLAIDVAWPLLGTLCLVGTLRLYYVLPSAILGAIAPARLLSAFGFGTVIGVLLQVSITILVRDAGLALAAAIGLLAATLVRVMLAVVLTRRALNRQTDPYPALGHL